MEKSLQHVRNQKLIYAYLQLLFTSFSWALSTILIKLYIGTISPFHLLMARFFIGALVILLGSPKTVFRIKRSDFIIGSILGLFIFAAYALNIIGLKYTSASKSGFLAALSVLFIPIIEALFKKRMPSIWTILCVVLSLGGLYLISGMNGGTLNLGDMLTIGCAITYTFYILFLDKFGQDIDNYVLSLIQLSSMFIISLFIVLTMEGFNLPSLKDAVIPILLIGVLGTGMTMFFQTRAQKVASPESVGLILLGEPLFTLIMAYVLLHEIILFKGILGSFLILSALMLAIIKKI